MENKLKEVLSSVKQMVICTCKENKPWAATVIFACDQELNLYFFSSKERRHSKEIKKNKYVAGAVASEHKQGLHEPVHLGVQFEGTCQLVNKKEAEASYELFRKCHPRIVEFHDKKDAIKELYKVKVKKFVLFDTSKKNMRQEIVWQS